MNEIPRVTRHCASEFDPPEVTVVVRVATVLLSGCNSSCSRLQYTQCYSTSWYTVASGMVGVVVRVATVLSGCNSSCSRLQYTVLGAQCYNILQPTATAVATIK